MLDTPPKRHPIGPRKDIGPHGEWVSIWTHHAMPEEVGMFADTNEIHRFIEMTIGFGGSQCLLCFGWFDDPRHFLPRYWQMTDDAVAARYEDIKEWSIFDDTATDYTDRSGQSVRTTSLRRRSGARQAR